MAANISTVITRMSHTELLAALEPIVTIFTTNPPIPEPFPDFVPSSVTLKDIYERFKESHHGAQTGNHLKTSERNALRPEVNRTFIDFADFVELASRRDPTMMIKSGLDVFRRPSGSTNSSTPATVPTKFTVQHGSERGTIIGKVTGLGGARSVEVQITDGDPTVDANWRHYDVYGSCARMEMANLEPGKLYSFRVRAVGTSSKGPWSHYVSLMAI